MDYFSIFLARFLGIFFIIVSVSIILNKKFYSYMIEDAFDHPISMFILAIMDLLFGLLLVLLHQDWVANWTVLITIIGWLLFIRGTIRLAFPEKILAFMEMMNRKYPDIIYVGSGIFLTLGLFLTYKSFFF